MFNFLLIRIFVFGCEGSILVDVFLRCFSEDYRGLGFFSDSFGEIVFSIRRRELELF